jgi:DnaJ-domain-containing protein 1
VGIHSEDVEDEEAAGMSETEALEVLGLEAGADEAAIRAAHRRLIRLVHPDHSGTSYLSNKVHEAKDTLLPGSQKLLRPFKEGGRN